MFDNIQVTPFFSKASDAHADPISSVNASVYICNKSNLAPK